MPSMSGMWMSVSTRSAGVPPSIASASRPVAASPTTTSGSAAVQSSSSSRSLLRAGASSSTTRIFSGASPISSVLFHLGPVGHTYMHLVGVPVDLAFEARLRVEVKRETLADIGKSHLVPGVVIAAHLIRIAQDRMNLAPAQENINRDHPSRARRFDPVVDGVFEERLKARGRPQGILRHIVYVPFDLQPLAEPQHLDVEILSA